MSFRHLPGAFLEMFSWFQKAALGTGLPLKPSRRPRLPLTPSRRPWRPSSMSFGHLPGAFLEMFSWFQKATLGTFNPSRRPRLHLNPFPAPLAAQQRVLAYASFFSSLIQLFCVHGRPAGVLCCTRMRPDAQADHTAAWHRGHVCIICFRVASLTLPVFT